MTIFSQSSGAVGGSSQPPLSTIRVKRSTLIFPSIQPSSAPVSRPDVLVMTPGSDVSIAFEKTIWAYTITARSRWGTSNLRRVIDESQANTAGGSTAGSPRILTIDAEATWPKAWIASPAAASSRSCLAAFRSARARPTARPVLIRIAATGTAVLSQVMERTLSVVQAMVAELGKQPSKPRLGAIGISPHVILRGRIYVTFPVEPFKPGDGERVVAGPTPVEIGACFGMGLGHSYVLSRSGMTQFFHRFEGQFLGTVAG